MPDLLLPEHFLEALHGRSEQGGSLRARADAAREVLVGSRVFEGKFEKYIGDLFRPTPAKKIAARRLKPELERLISEGNGNQVAQDAKVILEYANDALKRVHAK